MTSTPIDAGPVRPGDELDWSSLEEHLAGQLGLEGPMSVQQFPHGTANLTFLVAFGDTRLVVRRPPFGDIAHGAHDMRRESAVLRGLGDMWGRTPRCLHFCDDQSVIGADFLVMEYVPGVVIREDGIPAALAHHDDVERRISLALIDVTAELHLLEPDAVGLGALGRPDGFVERQVEGWWKRWLHVATPSSQTSMERVYEVLRASIPQAQRASIVHSDLKFNNCLFDPADPDRVRAVLDWDMATLGDPLVDLGTLLNYWPGDGDLGRGSEVLLPELQGVGLPSRDELVTRYCERTGIDADHMDFYVGFAAWKTAVVAQQLFHRYELGQSSDDRLASIGGHVAGLADEAELIVTRMSKEAQ